MVIYSIDAICEVVFKHTTWIAALILCVCVSVVNRITIPYRIDHDFNANDPVYQ